MNRNNILKLAEYMRSLPADEYDQTMTLHADGSPSCLLAHMLRLFGDARNPRDPIAAKEAAVELLGVDEGQADFLYVAFPLGKRAGKPSPRDACRMLKRLALLDKGVEWSFLIAVGDGEEDDLPYDWDQGGEPPICELPDFRDRS